MENRGIEVFAGRRGFATVRVHSDTPIYLHSLYDPVMEASELVGKWTLETCTENVHIIGLGLGYHVQECIRRFPKLSKVIVVECFPEIVAHARKHAPDLFADERVQIFCPRDEEELRRFFIDHALVDARIHPPSVDCIPYEGVRQLLQEMQMLQASTAYSAPQLQANWQANSVHIANEAVLSGCLGMWTNRLGLLVAAGPSVDTALPIVKQLVQRGAKVLCVSRVMTKLLADGILPAGVVASDSSSKLQSHFESLSSDVSLPPLYALPTVHPEVVTAYPGPVKWVLQSGMPVVEQFAAGHSYDLFSTGGSVATLALSLLHYFGCNPIVFIGQDLAYIGGKSHTEEGNSVVNDALDLFVGQVKTRSVSNEQISSNLSWTTFRRWIEQFIRTHPEWTFINASEGAAIEGAEYVSAHSLLEHLSSISVSQVVSG